MRSPTDERKLRVFYSIDDSENGPANGSDHHDMGRVSAIVDEITSAAVNVRLCTSAEKITGVPDDLLE